jgi:two-component system sensor histidine kinase KdpD
MAIVAVAAAALIRAALDPLLHTSAPLLVFVLAVLGVALYGGFRAGIAATILALLTSDFFFMEPRLDFTKHSASGRGIGMACRGANGGSARGLALR